MMTPTGSINLEFASLAVQVNLAPKPNIEHDGRVIYRSTVKDPSTGIITEQTYDQHQRLIRTIKQSPQGNRSDTHFDPELGQLKRVNEVCSLPDGNLLCKDIVYSQTNKSSEVVTIISPAGHLLKLIERENVGSKTVFFGQTNYNSNGCPNATVNQHMNLATGALTHREQVQWLAEGQRAMTEHFYFNEAGFALRYVKILHYATGGIFSEETQNFDPVAGRLSRRQLAAFNPNGHQTCLDVLYYGHDGQIKNRESTFFDSMGRPIVARDPTQSFMSH